MSRLVLVLLLTSACAQPGVDPPLTTDCAPGDVLGEDQAPPQGHAALTPWIAGGAYLAWACEEAAHPARPPGAHGSNRICSNALLSMTSAGPYPPGAASVKELVRDGAIIGHAVGRKLDGGWYWYEVIGTEVIADSVGAGLCAGCHVDAPRDHVFTRVP